MMLHIFVRIDRRGFAAPHYKSELNGTIYLATLMDPPYTSARLQRPASLKADIVWSLGSGVANDVDYVAAELSADGPRTLHE